MSEPVIDLAGLREEWGPSGFEVTDVEDAPACLQPMPARQTVWEQLCDYLAEWVNTRPMWFLWSLPVLAVVLTFGWFFWEVWRQQ